MERHKLQQILVKVVKKYGNYVGPIDLLNIIKFGMHKKEKTAINYLTEMEHLGLIHYSDGVFEIKYYRKDI